MIHINLAKPKVKIRWIEEPFLPPPGRFLGPSEIRKIRQANKFFKLETTYEGHS